MTLYDFFENLETEILQNYIVMLKYKYNCEEKYTYSNELLLVDEQCNYVWHTDWYEGQTTVEVVDYIAVADVAKVVRCKDCRYTGITFLNGMVFCRMIQKDRNADDFCSYGERKKK